MPHTGAATVRALRPLRVVHVCGGGLTGCTRVVLNLLQRHDRDRVAPAVCFFTRTPAAPEVIAAVEAMGLPWRDVVKASRYSPGALPSLARALRQLEAEVVVLHGFGAYTFGAPAARLAGVRALVRVEHSPELGSRLQRLAARATGGLVHSTVLVSRYLGEYLAAARVATPSPELIYNGIDLATLLAVSRPALSGGAPPTLLMAARLDAAKDHATLLRAAARLARRGVAFRLWLAGAGPFEGELRQAAHAAGLADRVEFLGHRDDVPALLEAADVSVLSTHYEGFGLAVVEAMAAARPVVATRVTSIPELIVDGETGVLVPHGSDEALADAIGGLLADPPRARAMGEAARRTALERFSLDRSALAVEEHILRTAARRGLAPRIAAAAPAPVARVASDGSWASRERSTPATSPTSAMLEVRADHRPLPTLRVLHLINDLGTAGAEQVVCSLVSCRAPHVVAAVARLNAVAELDDAVRAAGAEVHALGVERTADLPAGLLRLDALLRRFRPDIVHTHLLHSEILGGLLARLRRVPVVATVHNVMWGDPAHYSAFTRHLYLRVARANQHTVAVAVAVKDVLDGSGIPGDRVSVIPNGIPDTTRLPRAEARARLGLPDDAGFVIGAVGNLYPYKGHDLLLEAAARLLPARPDLRVVIIGAGARTGEGGCRDALLAQAATLGIAERVHLPGRVPAASSLLAAFDTYAQPSRTEGASIALLEALAAGLPCVASTVGGTPELVGDGGAALLVPPDDVTALAAALERVVSSETMRADLAVRARARSRRFSAAAMTGAYERLYHRVLGRPLDEGEPERAA